MKLEGEGNRVRKVFIIGLTLKVLNRCGRVDRVDMVDWGAVVVKHTAPFHFTTTPFMALWFLLSKSIWWCTQNLMMNLVIIAVC